MMLEFCYMHYALCHLLLHLPQHSIHARGCILQRGGGVSTIDDVRPHFNYGGVDQPSIFNGRRRVHGRQDTAQTIAQTLEIGGYALRIREQSKSRHAHGD